jgi:hypothetical protein
MTPSVLSVPIFFALAPLIERCAWNPVPSLAQLNALLTPAVRSGGGVRLRFVPPDAPSKDLEAQYEMRVFRAGEVQTRPDNWHDVFNALVWLSFPATKALVNRHHYEELLARRGEPARGTARDVLTLFDEGGILVASAAPALSALLMGFEWKELFWRRRHEVSSHMRFFVFGHAIYEKAVRPYRGITAKALIVDVAQEFFDWPLPDQLSHLDERAAGHFGQAEALSSTQALQPLPILGVPGWDPASEDEAYYDDVSHFRPGRRGRAGRAA